MQHFIKEASKECAVSFLKLSAIVEKMPSGKLISNGARRLE